MKAIPDGDLLLRLALAVAVCSIMDGNRRHAHAALPRHHTRPAADPAKQKENTSIDVMSFEGAKKINVIDRDERA